MFWAISAGIMTGAGLYVPSLIASAAIGVLYFIAYLMGFRVSNRYLLVIKYNEKAHQDVLARLKKLHKLGYKVGIVSSKKNQLLVHGLEAFDLAQYIDVVIGADDVKVHKPAPDALLLAKQKLNGKNVMYVGDTMADIQAAKNANMKSVGCIYIKHPEIMLEAKPDYVIENLGELLKILGE